MPGAAVSIEWGNPRHGKSISIDAAPETWRTCHFRIKVTHGLPASSFRLQAIFNPVLPKPDLSMRNKPCASHKVAFRPGCRASAPIFNDRPMSMENQH
jgi:hypothetical protein